MRRILFGIMLIMGFACHASQVVTATQVAHPLFLKIGFSSIVEFTEPPTQVVLGDREGFQVEKMDKSLVVRALASYATTNMFVYFRSADPKLFTLTSSEDVNPTQFTKFDLSPIKLTQAENKVETAKTKVEVKEEVMVKKAKFDTKKDFLTIDFVVQASSQEKLKPKWDEVRLSYKDQKIKPQKIWSERQEIQKDTKVKGRIILLRPNIPKDLKDCYIILPVLGKADALKADIKKEGN